MSERRSEKVLRDEIHHNARDVLSPQIHQVGIERNRNIALWTIAEILLDIREHLDGIEARPS